jgi:addiction module HigA family antidote
MAQRKKLPPIHPGELLRDELTEIDVSLNALARALRVPMNRISAIVNGKRAITVDTAIRLARYFGTSPQFWLNLQNAYDLEVADRALIEKEVLPRTAA